MSFFVHSDLPTSLEALYLSESFRSECLGLWTMAGSWASKNRTGGIVKKNVIAYLGATDAFAEELVRVELWSRHPSGYEFFGATAAYEAVDMDSIRRPSKEVLLKYCKLPSKAYIDWHKRHGKRANRNVTDQTREAVISAHGMVCWLCELPISSKADLHLDHVIPRSLSGEDTADNLRPAHALCNIVRGSRTAEEFRRIHAHRKAVH